MSRNDSDLHKSLKKACSIEETAPKRKHVRAVIVFTWDHQSAKPVFQDMKTQPFVNDEVQLFKSLIVLHKVIQEGHPSALKEAIRESNWIKSLARVQPPASSREYGSYSKLIREYVKYLVLKLNFHAHHKGFNSGTFEYEEYISLINVADPDEGYETILDLMYLQDSLDKLSQIIFASIQSESRNSECKISALIPLVAESYGIYKFITSMLRAMHRQLNDAEGDEALQPLKDRYESQHARLFEFYADCSSIKYLTTLVTIPKLPTEAPDVYLITDEDTNKRDITFKKREKSATPIEPNKDERSETPSRVSSNFMTPMTTAAASALIPTATAALSSLMPTTMPPAQIQPEFWINQQQQLAYEQAKLEQQRQMQLQQQQAEQHMFQQQLQKAQDEMVQLQLQQQSQHQNDLLALNSQYEKDQTLLQQYDQRVQQLENEINTMNENASQQLMNKDDQIKSLTEQLNVWEKKYDSLAKLYSQLRQEHLQLLPKFKKLQVKVNSAQEAIRKKEQVESKLKQKDTQLIDLMKERDKIRLENERMVSQINDNGETEMLRGELNATKEKMNPIIDATLEGGINAIQQSIYVLESPMSWMGPLTPASFIVSLIEGASEKATEFATSFNDLIVDGFVDGDQANLIFNISDFSTAVATLVTSSKAYASTNLSGEDATAQELLTIVKNCAREAQYFFEDLMSENLSGKDDEEKTDIVINSNVSMQEKLHELTEFFEPYLNDVSPTGAPTNAHAELVATAEKIVRSSQKLRVNVDVNVPKPLLNLALSIIDAVVALVKAAIECQNEIAQTERTPITEFYKKNSRWTEGLVSAAKAVATATNLLISTAGNLLNSDSATSPEEFIVASKEVAASTVQLVAASRVKSVAHSKTQDQLEGCSKVVGDACKSLVSHVMGIIDSGNAKEEQPIDFSTDHAIKTAEMEQQIHILKLEQSLNVARKRLGEIRKHAYYLNEEEEVNN
ncbi:hypothetical protein KAFR_0A08090 [Kazachstania africana CBS 2517]|uniref:I/LWEQ domain-containing protein n=1 Tax=Kazachstania africana (strain ATCC 22294 / BCRC 22015 / CBS 2517 / CECT 1963 / NBRC 1671 / NRRL Y-8276) TaxID=1071382 RepID=H2APE3_KAZAF|nr:hypothetical protein KAFR_0A08090 [Kazachstania africana CBS 2517]CCF56243.1 hypothetical protein KAFR_0A08090 [Kazachstania africana CBS 2517]